MATQRVDVAAANAILAAQRRRRPTSPHLGIYRPQVTWYLSALNRITGTALSGLFYVFGTAYLVAPLFGWQLGSAALAAGVAAWPVAAKVGLKLALAWPFTFHAFNGLRHLAWDTGRAFKNATVIRTGWTVVAASAASALWLALM
jgi:succinate dehydrogenase (ubiquinone) cytochrome b560 subunit